MSDADGHGLHLTTSPGQASDLVYAIPTLEGVIVYRKKGRPRQRPRVAIVADKAYTFRPLRTWAREHGVRSYLPRRKDQRPKGRPPEFDREAYRRRPAIERLIGRLKEWRAVGTRYDKLAVNYLATVQVALIADDLRLLERHPSSDRG